ncbi:hypothetical protein RHSIM_Rhsim09G0017900 [Rhododendron simsii]|uniref:Uncharacterized protein n=1 Tax=Rhododendron simsii TaxID=118357 RepID=A0A834GE55_RHOSS|nr:hypothetical protein RHSIM_Rhsim09G0017900 [Rhododendron simsii]
MEINSEVSNIWKDIMQIQSRNPIGFAKFTENIGIKIGNSSDILFWKDKWLEGPPLCSLFPRVFSIISIKDKSVAAVFQRREEMDLWDFQFRRNLHSWEVKEMNQIDVRDAGCQSGASEFCYYGKQGSKGVPVLPYSGFEFRLKMGSTHRTKVAFSLVLTGLIWALAFNEIEGRPTAIVTSTSPHTGRNLLQAVNVSEPLSNSDDTSTIYTGIPGYAIGVLWLLCGLVYGGFLLATTFCCKNNNRKLKKRSPCQKQYYLWHAVLAAFFAVLAIVATGLVLGGNAKFHSRAKTVVNIIIDTANDATETIYNTTGAMRGMSINLEVSNANSQASGFLTTTSQKLDAQAADIQRQAKTNRQSIDKGLKIVYIDHSDNLIQPDCCACPIRVLKPRSLSLKAEIELMDFRFEGDTCTALEDFQKDPYNSSLSSILPCKELLSAKSLLYDVSEGIYDLVNEVNANISASYSNIFQVCNPFSAPPEYTYQPDNCPANAIKIGDIPQLLKTITCSDTSNGTCQGGLIIPATDLQTVEAYTISLQNIINVYPGMENLVECQSVAEAFTEILHHHCKPLKRYTRMVWAALVFLSVIMVALVLIWTDEAHHQQNHHFSNSSVKPHSMAAEMIEAGVTKSTKDDSNPNPVL